MPEFENVDQQNETEDDEDVKSISGDDVIVETKKKGRKSKGKKEGKNEETRKRNPDPQKKCLKDIGFERMIHFPIVELPSVLAYHAIDHFHPRSMEPRLEKGSIKATRQKVHDMLGIPMGSRKLKDLEQRPSNDPFIKEWEKQFKHVSKPTPTAIASVISDTTEADFMF
nr:hypothetical protein [Tanacetum cinerariifolium]